jgi:hypothetical protein
VDADLDTLVTALYARIDDTLKDHPELRPWRPKIGIAPKLSDAELLTLAVLQVLQGFKHEARWVRHARLSVNGQTEAVSSATPFGDFWPMKPNR